MANKPRSEYFPTEQVADFREMLINSRTKWGQKAALMEKSGGEWVSMSYNRLFYEVMSFGCGLQKRGLRRQSKVAIASENRVRWGVTYLATACANGVCVPVDKDLKSQELFHVMYLTGAEIFVGSQKFVDMVSDMRRKLPELHTIVNMDDRADDSADNSIVVSFAQVMGEGVAIFEADSSDYPYLRIDPGLPVSIIYTSGTTGNAKGVMLSQSNVLFDVLAILKVIDIRDQDVLLSVLPIHHTYEFTAGFILPLSHGMTVAYAENLKRIPDNMLEVRATAMLGVPLLFEAIYNRIKERIREGGKTKFKIGKGIAAISEKLFSKDIRRTIFRPLHEKLGGNLKLLISGGAAISPHVTAGFRELGLQLLQGYGLTETSPVISVNLQKHFKDDSVGPPLPGVEVKIMDGEICVRGPLLMLGYYNNPEATAELIQDGWLHTGDLGYVDAEGFLYIHGRKKAVVVTSNGKNIYPEEVEAQLNQSPYILESLVWEGPEAHKYCEEVHAIIVPNIQYFDETLGSQGVKISDEEVEKALKKEVSRLCSKLANYKRVQRFTIQWQEFEKTTTKKIKRYLYTNKIKPVAGKT